ASDAVDRRPGSRLGGGIGSGADSQGEAAHGAALLFVASAPVVLREVVPAVVAKDAGQASQGDGGRAVRHDGGTSSVLCSGIGESGERWGRRGLAALPPPSPCVPERVPVRG